MEKLRNTILIASLVLVGLTIPVQAEMATMDEALTVAKNWVTLIIHHEGDWGGSESAVVEEVQEFKRGKRVVGYFCRVKPKGYIVVSLRKELAPVKAYSATGYLDPESEEGMADLMKADMERPLNAIEEELGPIKSARTEDVQRILKVNERSAWEELEPDVQTFKAGLESGAIAMAYDPGTWLLSTNWHQRRPYNKQCPDLGCTGSGLDGHAYVGCTVTAAAQIMRYWSWPPYGEGVSPYNDSYDWPNMLDEYVYNPAYSPPFEDGDGNPCTQAQINAVAELCYEPGAAAGMTYTCDWSFLLPNFMSASMRNSYRYSPADDDNGWDNDEASWHGILKTNLNSNCPVLYCWLADPIEQSHCAVVDGWRQVDSSLHWHINYGWPDTGSDTWYWIYHSFGDLTHALIKNIKPAPSLGSVLYGTSYPAPSFPYRYFDQDCMNYNPTATFSAGQNLQFLPGVRVKCIGNPGSKIRFEGTSSENTRLFSIKGTQSAGIKIYNGAIELYLGGGLRFH